MADLMRDHIGLRKFSRHTKTLLQFVEETKIDVDLLISGTIERSGGGLRHATGGIDTVTEKHQLCMTIRHTLRGQDLGPGFLCVVEDERDKLDFRLFSLISRLVRLTGLGWSTRTAAH